MATADDDWHPPVTILEAELPGNEHASAWARQLVHAALSAWGRHAMCDPASLVASELMAEAIRDGGSANVHLVVRLDRERVGVEVADPGAVSWQQDEADVMRLRVLESLGARAEEFTDVEGRTSWVEISDPDAR